MASSARIGYNEQVLHGQHVLKLSSTVRRGALTRVGLPLTSCKKSTAVMGKNFVGRVDKAAPGVHDDTTCVRILTESDNILCHDRLSNAIKSMSLSASCACNLRPETWRQWLPSWLSKRLMFAPSPGTCWPNLHTSSRGTLSAHSAVILTVSDIVSLLCLVPYDMTSKSLTEVFLRYSLASPVVARPCT